MKQEMRKAIFSDVAFVLPLLKLWEEIYRGQRGERGGVTILWRT